MHRLDDRHNSCQNRNYLDIWILNRFLIIYVCSHLVYKYVIKHSTFPNLQIRDSSNYNPTPPCNVNPTYQMLNCQDSQTQIFFFFVIFPLYQIFLSTSKQNYPQHLFFKLPAFEPCIFDVASANPIFKTFRFSFYFPSNYLTD